jgi:hypothetical protein
MLKRRRVAAALTVLQRVHQEHQLFRDQQDERRGIVIKISKLHMDSTDPPVDLMPYQNTAKRARESVSA